MPRNQRLTLILGAAVIVVVAFVIFRPDGGSSIKPNDTGAGPTLSLKAGVQDIRVRKGGTVRFRVFTTKAEEVHVHGYDHKYELTAGETKAIAFPASMEGRFDVEFEGSGTQIANLVVG